MSGSLSTAEGLEYSICNNSNAFGVTGFWTYVFFQSKLVELFDTAFLVLRKRSLIFLHWFHHATVLVLTWYLYRSLAAVGRWFVVINYGIHMFMYSYYACRALSIGLPRVCAVSITAMQIVQMLIGCFINYNVFITKRANRECKVSYEVVYSSLSIYFMYLLLFTNFFLRAYVFGTKRPTQASAIPFKYPRNTQQVDNDIFKEEKVASCNLSSDSISLRKRNKSDVIVNNCHDVLTSNYVSAASFCNGVKQL